MPEKSLVVFFCTIFLLLKVWYNYSDVHIKNVSYRNVDQTSSGKNKKIERRSTGIIIEIIEKKLLLRRKWTSNQRGNWPTSHGENGRRQINTAADAYHHGQLVCFTYPCFLTTFLFFILERCFKYVILMDLVRALSPTVFSIKYSKA